jgi:DNA-binding MarR family transcriptional regulator
MAAENVGRSKMSDANDNGAIQDIISSRLISLADAIRNARQQLLDNMHIAPGHDTFLLNMLRSDGQIMGVVAEDLGISASSATKVAIKLEEKGLIRRENSRLDSRQTHAWLTDSGRESALSVAAVYAAVEERAATKLKPKDPEKLAKLFTKIETGLLGKKTAATKTPKKPKKLGKKKK